MRIRCFGNSLHSATLILMYINLVVDLCYIKSVWFDYYNPRDDLQIRTYRITLLFTFLEMFLLACSIVTVIKKKSDVLDWIVIILTCNAFFAIFTKAVYLNREEFTARVESRVSEWNSISPPLPSELKLDLRTETTILFVTECLYCFGLVVLKIYSALTIHRYRKELESRHMFIGTFCQTVQTSYPAPSHMPKPPGYELWYQSPGTSGLDLNDIEAPPPYSLTNAKN